MDYILIGSPGLKVSELCFGTTTFAGSNESFKAWGSTDAEEAKRLIGMSGSLPNATPSRPHSSSNVQASKGAPSDEPAL